MTVAYTGDKGEPELVPSGATPSFAADVTEVAAWFQDGRTFRRVADMTALAAATGMDDGDLCVVDTIPGGWWRYDGTATDWILYGVPTFDDATARDAALTAPTTGDQCKLTSDGFTYRYTGSAWVIVDFRRKVASGTFGPTASSFDITGLTGYDIYDIEIDIPTCSTANAPGLKVLSGSTPDATASSYRLQNVIGSGTSSSAQNGAAASSLASLLGFDRSYKKLRLVVRSLNSAAPTVIETHAWAWNSSLANMVVIDAFVVHDVSSAFDGLRFGANSGTYGGSWSVVGEKRS